MSQTQYETSSDDSSDDTESINSSNDDIVEPPPLPLPHPARTESSYKLVLPQIYNSTIHGNPYCDGHYLVHRVLKNTNYYNPSHVRTMQFINNHDKLFMHAFIRDYSRIIGTVRFAQPQIAECVYLEGGEYVAILKTFYIRIIQRAWKKTFAQRLQIHQQKKLAINILYRLKHGYWPDHCTHLPSLKGLLVR
jgi:hypothetical protein